MKKEKEIHANFAVTPETAKVIARVHNKCKDGNGLELGMKNMNKKCVPVAGNLLHKMH